jgi:hypothetical protein
MGAGEAKPSGQNLFYEWINGSCQEIIILLV